MSKKGCSKCGEEFECCNEQRGCWCEDHRLSSETLEYLRKNYDNCLCPRCLKEFSGKELKNS